MLVLRHLVSFCIPCFFLHCVSRSVARDLGGCALCPRMLLCETREPPTGYA